MAKITTHTALVYRIKCTHISQLETQPPLKSSLPLAGYLEAKMQNIKHAAAAAAKSLQSCPTLCDPTNGSPSGFPVPVILQARTLEWVVISFSNAWKWKVTVKSLSRVWLLATPWTAAYQAPPSMGFSRQKCWSGVPLPSLNIKHNTYYLGSKSKGLYLKW